MLKELSTDGLPAIADGEGMSLPGDLATEICARAAAIAKRGRA